MPEMSQGAVKIEARAKIKFISDSTSLTPTDCVCAEILFPHESNVTGRLGHFFSFARLRLSWEHCPQLTSEKSN